MAKKWLRLFNLEFYLSDPTRAAHQCRTVVLNCSSRQQRTDLLWRIVLGERQLKFYRSHLVARASRPSKHVREAHAT